MVADLLLLGNDGRDKRLERRAMAENVWGRVTNVRPMPLKVVKAEAEDVVEADIAAMSEATTQEEGVNFIFKASRLRKRRETRIVE